MGHRDRQRVKRIRHGEELSLRQQQEEAELARKLDALEEIAQEYGGVLVAEELARLSRQRRLRV